MKPKKRAPRLHPLHPERGATPPRSFVFGATRCLVKDHDVDFTRTPDLPKNQVGLVFCNAFLGHNELMSLNLQFLRFILLKHSLRRWLLSWVMPYASEAPNIYRVLCIQWYCWIPSNVVSILDVNKKCAKFLGTHGDKYCIIAPSCKHVAITLWMRESRCTAWIFQVFAR